MPASFEKQTVLDLLKKLKRSDRRLKAHGAVAHRYKLNPPLPQSEVAAFEAKHTITLPQDYRYFITEIGNGGAGPCYGLLRFGEDDDGHTWDEGALVGDVAAPFPHDDAWNLPQSFWDKGPNPDADLSPEEEDRMMEAWDKGLNEHYWNPKVMNGAIPICHLGCALRQWLVINGRQKGFVWNDDRVDEDGLAPLHDERGQPMTFFGWYMSWLREPPKPPAG